ncbi:transcriptional regulator GcvA [Trinickia terrae]|uniref:Transcriptional regulator GcvA n=1 Tax=Trinickia terrae TaxID=2571161 RepID=A0A4U1IFI4_9BURK|nr:transcriptional regulator GcvA [Trinickia terrae]TKC92493.1 transcriptional regulator GcvA [Trinickia terrae]
MTVRPSLYALRCFVTVCRYSSVKLAAQELHVTPAAVSQQLSNLEDSMGIKLLERAARGVAPTERGERYFMTLRGAFAQIDDATRMLIRESRSNLTVSCTSGFAMQWLLPRLARFHDACPDIDVRISTSDRLVDFARDDVDFAIRHGLGNYANLISEKLVGDDMFPVCSPSLIRRRKLRRPQQLSGLTLLHDAHRQDWRLWLQAADAEEVEWDRGPVFVDSNGVVEAALHGHGVALARKSLIADELREGRLVLLFADSIEPPISYYLVYPAGVALPQKSAAFRAWLHREAAA